jgi:hypothetical protein
VVDELVSAHGELALALRDNKHQASGIIAVAAAVANGGRAIADAAKN